LRSKYHPETSIWKAKPNKPKSAFWAAILKVQPLLKSASFIQIFDGNSSIWSSPWFTGWENIHDNLIIQPAPFTYPAVVKDLWLPNQKTWNINLISTLFHPQTAQDIISTPIINVSGQDNLCWKLTPTGKWSSKSAYKHCRNNLSLPANQQPKEVPTQVKTLLNQIWNNKEMMPRIQTFAWRLLRRALPTGKRAGRFSIHIDKECSRCGMLEDEMHLFFLCPFAKAAWYSHPWFIRTEVLAADHHSVTSIIQAIMSSGHPYISVVNMYTFLWCLWKTRNDALFGRKANKPSHVYTAMKAILQEASMDQLPMQDCTLPQTMRDTQGELENQVPGASVRDLSIFAGPVLFSDASWRPIQGRQLAPAGLGVYIRNLGSQHCTEVHIAAISPPVASVLQAEAFALRLAVMVSNCLQIPYAGMFTDNNTLSRAAATNNIIEDPGHWELAPLLASLINNRSFDQYKIFHVARHLNFKADYLAKLTLRLLNRDTSFRCLCTSPASGRCPIREALSDQAVVPIRLVSVKCC
jgi:hypothetical protein